MELETTSSSEASPERSAEPAYESKGYWSDGQLLVVAKGVELPKRCVRCNAPAGKQVRIYFRWYSPWWNLLFALILVPPLAPFIIIGVLALQFFVRRMKLRVPLCRSHASRYRAGRAMMALGFIGLFAVPFAINMHLNNSLFSEDATTAIMLTSIPVMLILIIFAKLTTSTMKVKRIDGHYGWFKAAPDFLADCPDEPDDFMRM